MDRKRRFFSGLIAGYGAAAANLIFTVSSVPIALHYLSKEEFGLWSLVLQVANYLLLVDLGMSSSMARFLADHKDSQNQGDYGNVLQTGKVVLGIQALLIMSLAIWAGFFLHAWLAIPAHLVPAFQRLVWIQGLILAVGLFFRAYSSPLWAHQRLDIAHWATTANLLTALAVMWVSFHLGWGIDSLWIAGLVGAFWTWLAPWMACIRLGLFPTEISRGSFRKDLFWKMIGFGRDVFLMQLGGLLCSGSQIILVAKLLGLEAAAVFSIATKTLTMGQQLVGRVLESAAPGLTELFVRGERERFSLRFYQVTAIAVASATILAIALMGLNRTFVIFWTQGKVEWDLGGDFLMGGILIASVAARFVQGAFGMAGRLERVRFFPLIEGAVLVVCSLALGGRGGIVGIITIFLLGNLLISLLCSALQLASFMPSSFFWNKYPALFGLLYLLSAAVFFVACGFFASTVAQVFLTLALATTSGLLLLKAISPFACQRPQEFKPAFQKRSPCEEVAS